MKKRVVGAYSELAWVTACRARMLALPIGRLVKESYADMIAPGTHRLASLP